MLLLCMLRTCNCVPFSPRGFASVLSRVQRSAKHWQFFKKIRKIIIISFLSNIYREPIYIRNSFIYEPTNKRKLKTIRVQYAWSSSKWLLLSDRVQRRIDSLKTYPFGLCHVLSLLIFYLIFINTKVYRPTAHVRKLKSKNSSCLSKLDLLNKKSIVYRTYMNTE